MALTAEQLTLVQWVATPRHLRQPQHQEDLAALLKVTPQTLSYWKRHPEFEKAVAAASLKWGQKQLPKTIHALFKYSEGPQGATDRATILKYLVPALGRLDQDGYFDILTPDGRKALPEQTVQEELASFTTDEQSKFMRLLQRLGVLQSEMIETYTVVPVEREETDEDRAAILDQIQKETARSRKPKRQRYDPSANLINNGDEG